jgi:hypothetical protein
MHSFLIEVQETGILYVDISAERHLSDVDYNLPSILFWNKSSRFSNICVYIYTSNIIQA